jgi:predicted RNA-binding Zn ribbon-like protein
MPSELVDGLRIPLRLAGDPALDFCNTRAGWGEDEPKEYLLTSRHLSVWARAAGLVEWLPAEEDDDVLARALTLRDALYAVCTGVGSDAAWRTVAAEAERAACAARLTPEGWLLPETLGAELPLLAVARAAGELVASPRLGLVRACPGRGCGWLFHDRAGRRRWCTMAVCGNRAKARRHAARARATGPL